MKKLSLLFAAIVAVVSFTLRAATEVATAEELAAAITGAATDDIKLTANIDCTSWTTCDFSGTLDGNGKSISGLKVPLFTNLSGGVTNLTIDGSVGGVNTTITIPDLADFGLLALTTTAAHVESVHVKGYSLVNTQAGARGNPKNNIGFLAACAYDGSTFSQSIVMEGCTAAVGGDLFLGGFVGTAYCSADFEGEALTFSDCVNNAGFSSKACSSTGNGALGGILGREAVGYKSGSQRTLTFQNCVNNGSVTQTAGNGNSTFGGIVGQYSSGSTSTRYTTLNFISCSNHGGYSNGTNLGNNLRLGGMIGQGGTSAQSVFIDKCLNDGDFKPTANATKGCGIGGFIGGLASVAKYSEITIRNSINRGELYTPYNESYVSSIGGAIGTVSGNKNYAGVKFYIENCSFSGEITAVNKELLIAEFMSSTTINAGLVFSVDNCWFAESGDLINTAEDVDVIASYSATNIQFHTAGEDEAENAALALVAAGNDDYVTWLVSDKSGHPEPVLGATMYTVIFKDWDDAILSLQQVADGSAAEAPDDPVRVGFSFAGWDPSDFSEVTSNMTIVATYEQSANFRTVTFVDWNGTELAQVTIESGTAVGEQAPQPTRTGYTLTGWTLEGQPYDLGTAVTEDITLNAVYQINVYDVVFFDWEDNQLGETQKVAYLDSAVAPALPPMPEGKVFWKWSDDFSSVTEDMEVRAMICDAVQTISSAEGFAAAVNSETPAVVRIVLTADIMLENWMSVDFSATLDGQGHCISGLTKPLFNAVTGATVENLVISASTINATETGEIVGLLARTAGDGTTIRHVLTASDCSVGVGINVIAGGIVGDLSNTKTDGGVWNSWIVDSTNRAALTKTSSDVNSTGAFAGIVGRIRAKGAGGQPFVTNGILRCANFGPLTCAHNGGRMGGLVGKLATENDKALSAILDSGNFADLIGVTEYGSDDYKKLYAGGIASGTSTATYNALIDGCVNRGNVSVGFEPEGQTDHLDKTAGGMIAHVEDLAKGVTLTIRNSANYGNVSGENAAGVIATFGANANYSGTECHIENCACYGSVTGRTCAALAVGDWDKPNVAFTRMIDNSFFVADAGLALPIVGGPEGFVTTNLVLSTDSDFDCKAARKALNLVAAENGYESWVEGKVGDVVYPELAIFCTKPATSGLMVIIR